MSQETEPNSSTRRGVRTGLKVALVGAGIAAGAVGATALSAGAATSTNASTTSTNASTVAVSNTSGISTAASVPPAPGGYRVPQLSGTVTAVGSGSVTIKTSSATTTYKVTSASDIDKNGEAQLSNLVVGDAVTFNVMPDSATTINKLHAGDEAKDRPVGAPANGQAPPANGQAPAANGQGPAANAPGTAG